MKATHNIWAYQITTIEGKPTQKFDDDGERAAGSRLLLLLERMVFQS